MNSSFRDLVSMRENLREKLQAKNTIKPILKNSTGANEKKGNRIQRFAPPALVARLSGKKFNKIKNITMPRL